MYARTSEYIAREYIEYSYICVLMYSYICVLMFPYRYTSQLMGNKIERYLDIPSTSLSLYTSARLSGGDKQSHSSDDA